MQALGALSMTNEAWTPAGDYDYSLAILQYGLSGIVSWYFLQPADARRFSAMQLPAALAEMSPANGAGTCTGNLVRTSSPTIDSVRRSSPLYYALSGHAYTTASASY